MAGPTRAPPWETRSGTRVGVAGLYKDPSAPPTPFLAPRPRSRARHSFSCSTPYQRSSPVQTSDAAEMPQSVLVLPRRGQPVRKYTLHDVEQNMHLRQKDAAKRLHMSVSCLKKLCRQFGIIKWPRQIPEALLHKLAQLHA